MSDLVLCAEKAAQKKDVGRAAQEWDQPVILLPEEQPWIRSQV